MGNLTFKYVEAELKKLRRQHEELRGNTTRVIPFIIKENEKCRTTGEKLTMPIHRNADETVILLQIYGENDPLLSFLH